jgi:bifunctional DNA-binding transcriptional regulator/antitoxin component of YhaV-PrlF toxin-antitoxin module
LDLTYRIATGLLREAALIPKMARELSAAAVRKPREGTKQSKPEGCTAGRVAARAGAGIGAGCGSESDVTSTYGLFWHSASVGQLSYRFTSLEMEATAKISSKGQITLPRKIRELLGSDVVRIVADADGVRIEPVRPMAGRLAAYADRAKKSAEKDTWASAVAEKHDHR